MGWQMENSYLFWAQQSSFLGPFLCWMLGKGFFFGGQLQLACAGLPNILTLLLKRNHLCGAQVSFARASQFWILVTDMLATLEICRGLNKCLSRHPLLISEPVDCGDMVRVPRESCYNLVWGLEVGRLPLIIQVTQNVIIMVLLGGSPASEERGSHFPGPALVPVK